MPLSEDERRHLEELEEQLASDDPHLDQKLAGRRPIRGNIRSRIAAVLAVLAGLTLIITGIGMQFMVIGVAGFVLMCAGSYWFPQRH